MFRLIGSTLLLLTACGLLSAQDKGVVEVFYPKSTLSVARGSVARLSCEADYNMTACGVVHVMWYQKGENGQATEMTDPNRYLTTVSETITEANRRCRQVLTEILNVSPADEGDFHCNAECEKGDKAMGHLIIINIKG